MSNQFFTAFGVDGGSMSGAEAKHIDTPTLRNAANTIACRLDIIFDTMLGQTATIFHVFNTKSKI